jgi:AcrR family transcriptional regulator
LFAERGYAATTLRDVAERVGVRTPSLYNHFESKESLYAAVLERGISPVLALLAASAGDPARADSTQLVSDLMQVLARHPNLPRLVLHEQLAGGEKLTPMLKSWLAPALESARALVEAKPGARRWSEEQIPLLVLALYHVVVGYFTAADFYAELNGEDLLSEPAVERQARFLNQLAAQLFAEDGGAAKR